MVSQQQSGAERVRYYQSQLLTARDMQDDVAYEDRMRWLHVHGLHNTWGIALGFLLRLSEDKRQVTIGTGLAYDCRGREIMLAKELNFDGPLPPPGIGAGLLVFDLVVRYRSLDEISMARQLSANCLGNDTQMREQPVFRWAFAGEAHASAGLPPLSNDMRLGEDIPLGRFVLEASGLLRGPDPQTRRNVQPLLRPHITFGVTRPGELVWKQIQTTPGQRAEINTQSGGFSNPPFYFATLAHNPWNDLKVIGPFVSVAAPTKTSFSLELQFARLPGGSADDATKIVDDRKQQTTVLWLGIEPVTGCQPDTSFLWSPVTFEVLVGMFS